MVISDTMNLLPFDLEGTKTFAQVQISQGVNTWKPPSNNVDPERKHFCRRLRRSRHEFLCFKCPLPFNIFQFNRFFWNSCGSHMFAFPSCHLSWCLRLLHSFTLCLDLLKRLECSFLPSECKTTRGPMKHRCGGSPDKHPKTKIKQGSFLGYAYRNTLYISTRHCPTMGHKKCQTNDRFLREANQFGAVDCFEAYYCDIFGVIA